MKEQRRAGRRTVGLALGVGAAAAGMSLVPVSAAQAYPGPLVVLNTNDSGADSLRAAIILANADPDADTITFDSSVTGTITVDAAMDITESLTIVGPGASRLTLDGGDDDRIFTITGTGVDEATVISGLTLTGGQAVNLSNNTRADHTGTRPHTKGMAGRVIPSGDDEGYGGALYSGNGDLTLQNVIVKDNESTEGGGGAIAAAGGTLTVIGSTFSGNTAYYDGGAIIAFQMPVTLTGSTFVDNETTERNGGALAAVDGSLTVTGSTFSDNSADDDGGALALGSQSVVTLTGSTFTDNLAGDDGGAVYNFHAVDTTVADSTFTGNDAVSDGGAIYQHNEVDGVTATGSFTMTSSELSDNSAVYGGGISTRDVGTAIIDRSSLNGNQAAETGGGVFVLGGDFALRDSVVSGNDSDGNGGGVDLYQPASATISGSTIIANTSDSEGAGLVLGGDGALTFPADVVNSTISGNESTDDGLGSGVYVYELNGEGRATFTHSTIAGNTGDGLTSEQGGVTLQGSIVADNTVVDLSLSPPVRSASSSPRRAASDFSLDYSLVENPGDSITADVTAGSNLIGVDPQLGVLAANGGPTPTMLPASASPVLDKGKAFGTTTDQRGLARPSDFTGIANAAGGDGSDMGAVELQAPKAPTTSTPAAPVTAAPVGGSCDGAVATIVAKPGVPTFGTPGRDVIVGTAGADSISGGGGDDLICGLGGDDAIDTGAGRNRVFGGDGNDLIRGRGESRRALRRRR